MAKGFFNWLRTLGAPEDPVATDTSSPWSAMSLLKAIYGQLAGGGLQAALIASLAGTSSSSVAIATGSKAFVTEAGKSWQSGQWLNVASAANPANYMNGPVTSYDAEIGDLVVDVDNIGGSGTHADWVISLSGTQGVTGAKGDKGDQGDPGSVGVSGAPTTGRLARFAGPTSIEDAGAAISTDGALTSNSDAKVPTEKAVKTYADGLITGLRNGVSSAFDTLVEIATELGLKAPLASPGLTGTPTAPTAVQGTNTTQISTTAFVKTEITAVAMGQGKHTIVVPAGAWKAKASGGATAGTYQDIAIFSFNGTSATRVRFGIPMPKGWNEGTISFKAFGVVDTGGGSGNVAAWKMAAKAFSHDDAAWTTTDLATGAQAANMSWTADDDFLVSAESAALTIDGSPAEGDMVVFELWRDPADAADNNTAAFLLTAAHIYYSTNAATDA